MDGTLRRLTTMTALLVVMLISTGCVEFRSSTVIDREARTADLALRVGSVAGDTAVPITLDDLEVLEPYLVSSSSFDDGDVSGFDATYEDVPFDVLESATRDVSGAPFQIVANDGGTASIAWPLLGRGRDARPGSGQTHDEVLDLAVEQDLPLAFSLTLTDPGAQVLSANATTVSDDAVVWEYSSIDEFVQAPETFRADWDAPGTAAGGADWIVVIVGLVVVGAALWFFTRGRPTPAQTSQRRLHAADDRAG